MKIDPVIYEDLCDGPWNITTRGLKTLVESESAPEFGLNAENDYRRTFTIDKLIDGDEGWEKFQNLISHDSFRRHHYSNDQYQSWYKDGMKMGKFLAREFTRHVLTHYGIRDADLFEFKNNLFDMYFLKQMEEIGAHRVAGNKAKIMLTSNPADIIACSIHSSFSSCMSLDSSMGIWHTLPSIMANPNIAMLVHLSPDGQMTERKLSGGRVLKVPKILNRSWVYLLKDSKNKPFMFFPKFYVKQFVHLPQLTELTGLTCATRNQFKDEQKNGKSIHKAVFVDFKNHENMEVVGTPYFDVPCRIDDYNAKDLSYNFTINDGKSGSTVITTEHSMDYYSMKRASIGGSYGA